MNQKYLGFYNGIVVQNNDPDYAGKVKVWVPHISPTVYSGWIDLVDENKRFKFLGANVAQQFTLIVDELKKILPWADIALPLTNEGASGRYYANQQYGTISDSNVFTSVSANGDEYVEGVSLNKDNIGEKPAFLYEQSSTAVNDAFNTTDNNITHINPFACNYKPSSYSNSAKGEFGIPSVGAHVWVFFREGDVNYPVVCFASYGKSDWDGIFAQTSDYPGCSENIKPIIGEYNHNVDKYRSKYVLNQKGGTIEIINTDHNEKIKLTHYSGSFKEMNNAVTTELATNNDQKLVLNDQFLTVKGNKNNYTGGDYDEVTTGDRYIKVGNLNYNAFRDWKMQMIDVNDMRQLFDIKRTNDKIILKRGDKTILKFNSTKQTKLGNNPVNDVASYTVSAFTNKVEKDIDVSVPRGVMTTACWKTDEEDKTEKSTDTAYREELPIIDNTESISNISTYKRINDIVTKTPSDDAKLPKFSPSSMGGEFTPEVKFLDSILTPDKLKKIFAIEEQMGIGGSEITQITKDKIETIGLVLNDFGSIRIDSKGKYYASEMRLSRNTSFVNKAASPLIEYVHVDDFPGGTYTLNVNNKFNLLVGAGGMNLKTYGNANIGGAITNISGEQINIGSRNEINITSDKRISISAEILTLRQKHQKQVLVDSSLGVSRNLIVGGKSYFEQEMYLHHITAPREIQVTYPSTVYARPCLGDAGAIGTFDATFTLSANASNVNGFDHTAAAAGKTETLNNTTGSLILNGGCTITFTNCVNSTANSIICTSHGHNFDNIPITFKDSNVDVRNAALSANIDHTIDL